jgi:sugar phosphate isomerase/epimerase
MKINYVVSTMVFWWRENPLSFEQECEYLKSLGYGIELWPTIRGQNECRYDRRNWSRLAAATEGMVVAMRSRTDNPDIQQWAEQIECAKLLNASIVTDLKNLGIPDTPELNGCDFSADVINLAKRQNVKLCLETGELDRIKQAGRRFPSLLYCLDTGYANLDKKYDFRKYVDELGGRVAHLHLTDNYGQFDDHEAPGLRGGISQENWGYLLKSLSNYDYEITGALEMRPCMPSVMIRKASEFLFDDLKWPGKPDVNSDDIPIYNPL